MSSGWEQEMQRWRSDPTEEHQKLLNARQPADDMPIRLSASEAEKCAAVIRAHLRGLARYEEAVRSVAFLLSVRALDATGLPHRAADPWPVVAAAPWPALETGSSDRTEVSGQRMSRRWR